MTILDSVGGGDLEYVPNDAPPHDAVGLTHHSSQQNEVAKLGQTELVRVVASVTRIR